MDDLPNDEGTLLRRGMELAREAVKADEDKTGSVAIFLYEQALNHLFKCSKITSSDLRRDELRKHVEMYLNRLKELKANEAKTTPKVVPQKASAQLPSVPVKPLPAKPVAPAAPAKPKADLTPARKRLFDEGLHKGDRAQSLEEDRKYAMAFPLYQEAAQHFIDFLRDETDDEARKLIRDKVDTYIRRAEVLRIAMGAANGPKTTSARQGPTTRQDPNVVIPPRAPGRDKATLLQYNKITAAELAYLRGKAGEINGRRYPIWDDAVDGYQSVQPLHMPGTRFTDDFTPALSKKQEEYGAVWMRPEEFLPKGHTPSLISPEANSLDIVQSVVGDCSYVCSLTVCRAYEERFPKSTLISSAIYPQDEKGVPVYNPSGKYAVKLLLNGMVRMVLVDDRIVVSKGKGWVGGPMGGHAVDVQGHAPLCAHTASGDLWVSLCEKAFLKVHGGSYEFPGSNSSTDLYALCGWIPEVIDMDHPDGRFDKMAEWERLFRGHTKGSLVATICTPGGDKMPQEWREKLGLVAGHAYSILDFREVGSVRLLRVMNPWRQQRWLGRYSHQDNVNWTDELKEALNYDKLAAREQDNGVFWIDWNDVCKFFSRINLSWNPHRFQYRWALHCDWDKKMPDNNHFMRCPQYSLYTTSEEETVVWILLSRHMLPRAEGELPFITLHVFNTKGLPPTGNKTDGRRVPSSFALSGDRAVHTGVYRNAPQSLVRLTVPKGQGSFTVVPSSLEVRPFPFTLTVYSPVQNVTLCQLPDTPYQHTVSLKSSWEDTTSGGRIGSPSWASNPQFRVVVKEPTPLFVSLEIAQKFSVHLMMLQVPVETLREQGSAWQGRVYSPLPLDGAVAYDVGDYTPSFAHLDTTLPALKDEANKQRGPGILPRGVYTIVPSTYNGGEKTSFRLNVHSDQPVSVTPIPCEGAKMRTTKLQGDWSTDAKKAFQFCVFVPSEFCCRLVPQGEVRVGFRVRLAKFGGEELASVDFQTRMGNGLYLPYMNLASCSKADPYILEVYSEGGFTGAFEVNLYHTAELHVV